MIVYLFIFLFILINPPVEAINYCKEHKRPRYTYICDSEHCFNTRHYLLYTKSLKDTKIKKTKKAYEYKVTSGFWITEYMKYEVTDPLEIDIDHILPWHYACKNGLEKATTEEQIAFINDLDNLAISYKKINRKKGAGLEIIAIDEDTKKKYKIIQCKICNKYKLQCTEPCKVS